MTIGSVIGLIASFAQMMDKIALLKDSGTVLACNINDFLSCSTVLSAPQASVLGPPNALISTVMFALLLAVALVGLTGGLIAKYTRFATQFLAFFTLCFGSWFLYQSIFIIQSLCIYCVFNIIGLLLVNAAWLRVNYAEVKIGSRFDRFLRSFVEKNFDIVLWLTFAAAIAASVISKFVQ
jgi:uncharacterized membrane protein